MVAAALFPDVVLFPETARVIHIFLLLPVECARWCYIHTVQCRNILGCQCQRAEPPPAPPRACVCVFVLLYLL